MTRGPTLLTLKPRSVGAPTVKSEVSVGGIKFPLTLDLNLPTQRYIHDHIKEGAAYEGETTLAIIEALKPGDTFFDVGANCGWFSAVALQCVGSEGMVMAFEADLENCMALRTNAPGAAVMHAAVTDHCGSVTLYQNLDNDGGHSLWRCGLHEWNEETRAAGEPNLPVLAVKLDQFAWFEPAVIKCDTEGAELLVLKGAQLILAQDSLRRVILEKNEFGLQALGHTASNVERVMHYYGFKPQPLHNGDQIVNWIFDRA